MDLRSLHLSGERLDEVRQFIVERKVYYQPFVFSDELEVGEGLAFQKNVFSHERKPAVYWPGGPNELRTILTTNQELSAFREANQNLRRIYDHLADFVCRSLDSKLGELDFAEFGCNNGYFLHSLMRRGARRCIGFDFTDNSAVFKWFNEALGTHAEFSVAEWDSWLHTVRYAKVPEVDVFMSIAVTCHIPDPIHHISYLCSRSRKAVFIWSPRNWSDDLSISFGNPGRFPGGLGWPLSFDNEVRPSPKLLELTLKQCGFETLIDIPVPQNLGIWQGWFNSHAGIMAIRTSDPQTAYTTGRLRRDPPAELTVAAHASPMHATAPPRLLFRGRCYNIVQFRNQYFALPLTLGGVDLDKITDLPSHGIIVGDRLEVLFERLPAP